MLTKLLADESDYKEDKEADSFIRNLGKQKNKENITKRCSGGQKHHCK